MRDGGHGRPPHARRRRARSFGIALSVAIVSALLLAQMGLNIWQHTTDTRYFAWAPNDYLVTFDLHVISRGRALSVAEIASRYQLDMSDRLSEATKKRVRLSGDEHFVYEDAPQELKDRIRRYEQTKGKHDAAQVTLTYQLDGGRTQTWLWPS